MTFELTLIWAPDFIDVQGVGLGHLDAEEIGEQDLYSYYEIQHLTIHNVNPDADYQEIGENAPETT